MPSKVKPTAVRLPDDLKKMVVAHAKDTGQSEHAAILGLLRRGFEKVSLPPEVGIPTTRPVTTPKAAAILAQAEAGAAHLSKPPSPKSRASWSLKSVPLASDIPHPYGARLKGANGGKKSTKP